MIDPPGDNSTKAFMSRRNAGWDKSGESRDDARGSGYRLDFNLPLPGFFSEARASKEGRPFARCLI
jgi:hypothetical protein